MKIQKHYCIFFCIIFLNACAIDTGGANDNSCPTCHGEDAAVNNNNANPHEDRDDDGFTEDQGDCDDENPVIYPNAPEICDGHDNDCDGTVDEGCGGCESGDTRPCGSDEGVCVEGVQVCVNDVWGDQCQGGVGPVPEVCGDGLDNDCDGLTDESCNEPTDADGDGYTTLVDCDDSNPNVNPGTPEVCGNGLDDNCDGQVDENCSGSTDADGDGYTTQVDCDDSNPAIHPGATELCNGLDDDCDGQVDEGCGGPIDNDGDGYTNAVDCNDSNVNIYPGAPEVCNGIDDDCDGQIDEGCSSSIDADGDGYTSAIDCNDNNPNVNPGASEVCGNGLDDNCDGQVDEGCTSCPDHLTIERFGDQIWLSGNRADDFHIMEFWTNDNRVNAWVSGIWQTNLMIFTVPTVPVGEAPYNWFMPHTGYGESNPGAVLLLPDPCVQFVFDVYSCSVGGAGQVACPSLLECNQGGNDCPAPQ